jgi:hypothetical protein
VTVEHGDGVHVIRWKGTRNDTVSGYELRRRCPGADWRAVAFVPLRAEDPRNQGDYEARDEHDDSCEYAVAAVDADGRAGQGSDEI